MNLQERLQQLAQQREQLWIALHETNGAMKILEQQILETQAVPESTQPSDIEALAPESKTHIGLIAQDVEKIEKANGYGDTNDNSLFIHKSDDGEKYSLCYEKLIPVLVNAIKELSVKVTALEAG